MPNLRTKFLTVPLVAVIGFVSIHTYYPQLGILGNAMRGQIYLLRECTDADYEKTGLLQLHQNPSAEARKNAYDTCNVILPYKWVLIGSMIVIVGTFLMRRPD